MVAPPKPVDITVAAAVDRYLDICRARVAIGALSEKTVGNYQQNLEMMLRLMGDEAEVKLLDEVTGEDIDALTHRFAVTPDLRRSPSTVGPVRTGGKSATSQTIFQSALSAFFTAAKAQRWVQESPMDYAILRPGRAKGVSAKRKALSIEQAMAVLRYGAGRSEDGRTPRQEVAYYGRRAVLALLLYTGARNSELTGASRADFTPVPADSRGVGAMWLVHGKGGKDRVVPISAASWRVLREYWAVVDRAVAAGHLPADTEVGAAFVSSYGRRMNPKGVSRIVDYARDAVSAEPEVAHLARSMVPHAMRHTAATLMLSGDEASLPAVRDMLGHTNIALTSLYLDSSVDSLSGLMGAHPLQD